MVSSMVVGVDDSRGAEVALRWAAALLDAETARRGHVDAAVVAAWSTPPFDLAGQADGPLLEAGATEMARKVVAGLDDPGRFDIIVLPGAPADVLLHVADRRDSDLIVVGTRGRGALAQLLLGSVSRSVASRSERPVAVVPPSATWSDGPTVVGYDGSDGAEQALRWAIENGDGPITVVSAWELPSEAIYHPGEVDVEAFEANVTGRLATAVEAMADRYPDQGVAERITTVVQRDDPRLALVEQAKGASRVVIGARANRGIRGMLLGSTVDFVASHSDRTVVIVPPVDDRATDG